VSDSAIEWTDEVWNPVRGCTRVSEGCRGCYAEVMAARNLPGHRSPTTDKAFAVRTDAGPRWTGAVELIPHKLLDPLWMTPNVAEPCDRCDGTGEVSKGRRVCKACGGGGKVERPRRVFVNSMSDLFHEALPDAAIDRVFAVMVVVAAHRYQVLTKRIERAQAYLRSRDVRDRWVAVLEDIRKNDAGLLGRHVRANGWPALGDWPLEHIALGVSIEDNTSANARVQRLLETPAATRFISYEPALELVDLSTWLHDSTCTLSMRRAGGCGCTEPREEHIDWVIVGGESGNTARPFDVEWAAATVKACRAAKVPVYVKQLGAWPTTRNLLAQSWPSEIRYTSDAAGLYTLKLKSPKGGNPEEWRADLRVREFPR
jgi:protein gp37